MRPPTGGRAGAGHGAGRWSILLLGATVVGGCAAPEHPVAAPDCGDRGVAFAERVTVEAATGFTVEYGADHALVTVLRPAPGVDEPLRYLLLRCGAPDPPVSPEVARITVPVRGVVTTSTTQVAHLEAIGALDQLVGHSTVGHLYSPAVRQRVVAEQVVEVGDVSALDLEHLAVSGGELLFTYAVSGADLESVGRAREAGVIPVVNAEFLEPTVLGRAEWMKLSALFVGREATANARYDEVKQRYLELRDRVAGAEHRPTVVLAAPFRGTWWMPGGETFAARLLADAGADYLWADEPSSAALPLDLETVFERAAEVEVWLHPGGHRSLAELRAADPRLGELRALVDGRVYSNDRRATIGGGNDYWESAVVRPDLVLADLVHLLHPELLPDHELVYHRRLPAEPEP